MRFSIHSLMGVFSFISVSGWPVWSSGFGAASSKGVSADWLAVLLLSISAGWKVVLDQGFGSSAHFFGFDASAGVGAVADLDDFDVILAPLNEVL